MSNTVLFPGVVLPIAITGNAALGGGTRSGAHSAPCGPLAAGFGRGRAARRSRGSKAPEGLHNVGTAASIVRFITAPDGSHHLIAQGEERFTVLDYVSHEPFLVARIETHKEPTVLDREIEARGLNLREKAIGGRAAAAAGARANSSTRFAASSRFRLSPT